MPTPAGYAHAAGLLVRASHAASYFGAPGPVNANVAGGAYGDTARAVLDGTTLVTAATVYGQVQSTDGSGIYGADAVNYPAGYPRDLSIFFMGTQIHCYCTTFTSSRIVLEWKLQQTISALMVDLYALAWGASSPTVLRDLSRVYLYGDNFDAGTLDSGWTAQNCAATLHGGYVTLNGSADPAGLARDLPPRGGSDTPNLWLDISADVRLPSVQQENWPDLVRVGLGIRRKTFDIVPPSTLVPSKLFNDWLIHTTDYQTLVRRDGATVYWRMDDTGSTAIDAMGNGGDGAITGGVTHGVTGPLFEQPNPGMTFDGSSGQITEGGAGHTNNSGPTPGNRPFTLECWFKTTTTQGGLLVGFGDSSAPGGASANTDKVLYMSDDGQVHFTTEFATVWTIDAPLNDGQWHYAVATVNDGAWTKLWIDGVDRMQAAIAFSSLSTMWMHAGNDPGLPNVAYFGGLPDAPSSTAFAGSLDEVAVYAGVALSGAQIAAHYAAGLGPPQPQAFLEDFAAWHTPTSFYTGFTSTGWGGWAPASQWVSLRAHFGWGFGWKGRVWDPAQPEPTSWQGWAGFPTDYFRASYVFPAVRLTCPSLAGYPVDFRYVRVRLGVFSAPVVTVVPDTLGGTSVQATQAQRTVQVESPGSLAFPSTAHVPFYNYSGNAGARPVAPCYALQASDPLGRVLWRGDGQTFDIYRLGTLLARYGEE